MHQDGWRARRIVTLAVALFALSFGVAACGDDDEDSSGSSSGTAAETTSGGDSASTEFKFATDEEVQALLDDAFGGGTTLEDLPEVAQEAYKIMANPVTPEELATIEKCLKSSGKCDLGKPDATIDVAESEDTNNPYHHSVRAVYLLQAIREPAVKSITYTQANFDVQTALSNFRSHISQGADVIVGTLSLGDAYLPVVKQAAAKDITVWSNTQGPESKYDGSDLAGMTHVDLCQYGKDLAALAVEEGGKDVAMYSGPEGNAYAAQWMPCAEDQLKELGANLVIKGATNWTPQGEAQAAAALAAKGLPDAVIYDYTPQAFFEKFLELDKTPPTQIGGSQTMGAWNVWNETNGTKHEFKNYIAASQITLSAVSLHAAIKAHEGEDFERDIVLPEPIVPAAEVEPYYNAKFPSGSNFGMGLPEEVLLPAFEAAG